MKQRFFYLVLSALISCQPTDHNESEIVFTHAALVITTDYQTGSYSVVDPITRNTHNSIGIIHQDAVCRVDAVGHAPWIINRLGSDAIDLIEPTNNWQIAQEFSVGPGSNPYDLAVISAKKAYVSGYEENALRIINPQTGVHLGSIDLSPYADADGLPEAGWMYYVDDKVYLLLQLLDRPAGFVPAEHGLLVAIDPQTDTIAFTRELAFSNPFGKLRYNAPLNRLVVIESGAFTTLVGDGAIDGGIEFFDPRTGELSGPVVLAQTLGGDIVDAVIADETKGYAIISKRQNDRASTHLVSFNPQSGEKLTTMLTPNDWVLNTVELTPDHQQLWVAQRTISQPGIRIFDTATDNEITDNPIDVGLPPSMICFVDEIAGAIDITSTDADTVTETDAPSDTATSADTALLDSDSDPTSSDPDDTDSIAMHESIGYATEIIDAPCADDGQPFGDATMAVNGVRGGGVGSGSQDVFSMRYCTNEETRYITLSWGGTVVQNGPGVDFAVFENSTLISGGPDVFMEQLVVYVSWDAITWVPMPFDYTYTPETAYSANPTDWQGFAGVQPVRYHEESNPVNPFDAAAGGDQFDLDTLPADADATWIKENGFKFIKLVQATTVVNPDTMDPFLADNFSFDGAAEIDGIYARYLIDL